jgi:hypothetical protein
MLQQPAPAGAALRARQHAGTPLRPRGCGASPAPRGRRAHVVATASADGANVLAKLGRVFKEKAQADIDRIFKARGGGGAPRACAPACALLHSAAGTRAARRGKAPARAHQRASAPLKAPRSPLTPPPPVMRAVSQGTSKTREKLAVVDELLAYWKVCARASACVPGPAAKRMRTR